MPFVREQIGQSGVEPVSGPSFGLFPGFGRIARRRQAGWGRRAVDLGQQNMGRWGDRRTTRNLIGRVGILGALIGLPFGPATAQSVANLQSLSLEELGNIQVTSVSKQPEALSAAPAAVYVISHDDIIRSGATSIPEMLRLAPNLQVVQTSPSSYIVTARGFNGNSSAQNFSDKLLVLIDGRSVYNPLFSGMYWDMQDVPPEEIERIEVISGPGATLWGANAVNGVINIVTRKSSDTQGGVLEVGAGNQESLASLQYGGRISDDATYRAYIKTFHDNALDTASGGSAHDGWSKPQGGFRVDWTPGADQLTVEGDIYDGREEQPGTIDQTIAGGNITANWQHQLANGSSLQVLAYYDNVQRVPTVQSGGFRQNTYDIEVQNNFSLGSWNSLVWGAGERLTNYRITDQLSPVTSLIFDPSSRQLNLSDVFVQDRMSLADDFDLTLGLKLEDDPYSGISPMPNIRASWRATDTAMFWAAASQAIRSPTPFDTDVVEKLGPTVFITGNPDFLPEKLTAYEVGYRQDFSPQTSLSVSAFDSDYNDLRTIEFSSAGGVPSFPLLWGNKMRGNVYGIEAWGTYQPTDWWRLSAGGNIQTESLHFKPGASQLLGLAQAGDDPHHSASLRSSMDLTDRVSFDVDMRYVGELPNPHVPSYVEMNSRLAWRITDRLELSISGFNLLHAHHQEYTIPPANDVKRSFFIDTRWKF
jgi:iron complex outermembrane receptor protein